MKAGYTIHVQNYKCHLGFIENLSISGTLAEVPRFFNRMYKNIIK